MFRDKKLFFYCLFNGLIYCLGFFFWVKYENILEIILKSLLKVYVVIDFFFNKRNCVVLYNFKILFFCIWELLECRYKYLTKSFIFSLD